jgi:hypothetical protein
VKTDPSRGRPLWRRLPPAAYGSPADDRGGPRGHRRIAGASDSLPAVAASAIVDGMAHRNNGAHDHRNGKYEK